MIDPELEERIREMLAEGVSQRTAALAAGVHRDTVKRVLDRMPRPRGMPKGRLSAEQVRAVLEFYRQSGVEDLGNELDAEADRRRRRVRARRQKLYIEHGPGLDPEP